MNTVHAVGTGTAHQAHVRKKEKVPEIQSKSANPVAGSFEWPPKGRMGEFTIQFGKPQSWVDKKGWTLEVTWHATEGKPPDYKHCELEDWDKGGHACPSMGLYLFEDSDPGERRILSLIEDKNWREGPQGPQMHFRRIDGGWIGSAVLESKNKSVGEGLLLLHLNDSGRATLGLWAPSKEKFYTMDEKSFVHDPNAPLRPTGEKSVPRGTPLPAPFNARAARLESPAGILPFLRRGQNYVKWELKVHDGKPFWSLDDFVIGDGKKEFSLPLSGQTEITAPARGIFRKWVREKNRWVSVAEGPASRRLSNPETFGLIDKSRLRLALHDNGGAVLSVEEERTSGEKRVYRLDPKWLEKLDMDKLKILSMKKLGPNEGFESYYTDDQALQQNSLADLIFARRSALYPPISYSPVKERGMKTLGGVAI